MKNKVIRTASALLLLVSMALCLCACHVTVHTEVTGSAGKELQEKVEANLKNHINQDDAAAYEAFYPGSVNKDTFPAEFHSVLGYFPITEDYKITLLDCQPYRHEDDPMVKLVFGRFLIEFDGQKFYLDVRYAKDREHEGFQTWNIMDEDDYAYVNGTAQSN